VNEFQISSGITAFWMGKPRDTDTDGVPNKKDRCPETPKGSVVDAGGCPLDTDGDKVFDGLDKCANTPPGAIVDPTGCPLDVDADGVFDGIDKCDSTATGIMVDAQGCPMDTDGDLVFDGPDRCPGTPRGSTVDATGCPLDADGDGVPDGVDTCPFTPTGAQVNAGGCPITQAPYERELMQDWVMRVSTIEFVPDSVKLTPQGMARIDSVGAVMAQWPMLKFEVGVHSDNLGEDVRRQPLSHLRARYLLQYLYSKYPSLNPKNYWYTGYGDAQPIASNKTPEGRAMNRRAEFRLMTMDALTKERERREALGTTPVSPAPGLPRRAPGEPTGTAPPSPPSESSAPNAPAAPRASAAPGASTTPGASAASSTPLSAAAKPTAPIPPAPTPPDSIPPAQSQPDSIPPPPPGSKSN
jgi:outer membrane protein OmpA-like peptidoglycan-associated protein